jgi:hypothetical protein
MCQKFRSSLHSVCDFDFFTLLPVANFQNPNPFANLSVIKSKFQLDFLAMQPIVALAALLASFAPRHLAVNGNFCPSLVFLHAIAF